MCSISVVVPFVCAIFADLYFYAAYCSSVLFDKTNGVLEFLRGSANVDEVYIQLLTGLENHTRQI